ncbi:MAG: glycosyltransferase family 4 protein [Anderseniella sp.]|jgi:glycosyltransferase involved in cell wall biosynthesis|nr:glycosyltransferase family 4 protein [Anderseniella sp.]
MRILHIFRAPVGGLFRHVRDLARGQAALGHDVGVICDSTTGDALADKRLDEVAAHCTLGVHRVPMSRLPGPGDIASASRIVTAARKLAPHIAHGHGAKGGVYARLAAARLGARAVYTPHGGVLHYSWNTPQGIAFLAAERLLLGKTDGLVFVCQYEKDQFASKIGLGKAKSIVAHNGLWNEDFSPVPLAADAADILFVGELRALKGVDELLDAIALMKAQGRTVTATITGAGPDEAGFKAKAAQLAIDSQLRFTGALPAREAFAKGWLMVIPSRAESFPYIVLETVAAAKPLVATSVGGVPEVLEAAQLTPPNDPEALAQRMIGRLDNRAIADRDAQALSQHFAATLSASRMAEKISGFHASLLR